jgi:hypothetical protein
MAVFGQVGGVVALPAFEDTQMVNQVDLKISLKKRRFMRR